PALWIGNRGHAFLGLVECNIGQVLGSTQQASIDLDVVSLDVGLGTQLSHGLSVHRHATFDDQLFGLAPAGDTRLRQDLLETLFRHFSRAVHAVRLRFRAANRLAMTARLRTPIHSQTAAPTPQIPSAWAAPSDPSIRTAPETLWWSCRGSVCQPHS